MNEKKTRGQLLVISGPSGSGKGTVIGEMFKRRDDLYFSVSFTTRDPRPGEVDGVSYNFVSKAEFERMIADHELLEYAQYGSNYYGTSLKLLEDQRAAGYHVLLDIEVQGAAQVRKLCPDATLAFLTPPSFEELERRLRGRGTETEEQIQKRLATARVELPQMTNYDYLVVNDNLDRAVEEMLAVLTAAQCRTENRYEEMKRSFAL